MGTDDTARTPADDDRHEDDDGRSVAREAAALGDGRGRGTTTGTNPGGVAEDEADQPGGAVSGEIGVGEAGSGRGDLGGGADVGGEEDRT